MNKKVNENIRGQAKNILFLIEVLCLLSFKKVGKLKTRVINHPHLI
jgi:hypothetical protein